MKCMQDGEAVLCDLCEAEVLKVPIVSEMFELSLMIRISILIVFLLSSLLMAAAFLLSRMPLSPTLQNRFPA